VIDRFSDLVSGVKRSEILDIFMKVLVSRIPHGFFELAPELVGRAAKLRGYAPQIIQNLRELLRPDENQRDDSY
jgi:hypothetical protein